MRRRMSAPTSCCFSAGGSSPDKESPSCQSFVTSLAGSEPVRVRKCTGTARSPDSQAPRPGGVLNVMQREDLPQGFAVHETSTVSTSFPSLPCFNNLVVFDPAKATESMATIVGDLAEKWSWQDNYRNLVFFLRALVGR